MAEVKKEAKKEVKEKATAEKAKAKDAVMKTEAKKPEVKKKYIPYVKKENKTKSPEAKKAQGEYKKKWHPVFRGRFGKAQFRRKSIEKWQKWRKPHGIDLDKGAEHGARPKTGYANDAEYRGMHPSGYREVLVNNVRELDNVDTKTQAARIGRTVGKRKRNEIVKKANEKKIWVLN
ncbi:MAG: eL32 family ribosomal protein [archaeon]